MLTVKRLKELLRYDPDTGEFTRKVRTSNRVKTGSVAGTPHNAGYIHITVDWKRYLAHRLAWFYVHGYFPEHQIDHLNGIRDDNRLINLREVTRVCNLQNQKRRSTNTSGFPGVSWHKPGKKWRAQAKLPGKHIYLGSYPTAVEAALARLEWELTTEGWHCNHQGILATKVRDYLKLNPKDRKHLCNYPNADKFLQEEPHP